MGKFGTLGYCPSCGTKLTETSSGLKCNGCGRKFGEKKDFSKDRSGKYLPKIPRGSKLVRGD